MKNIAPKPVFLKDYKVPSHLIDKVELTFDLDEEATLVRSRLEIRRNENSEESSSLVLHGEELAFLSVRVDGRLLEESEYQLDEKSLTILECPESCVVEVENKICPKENTALEGLYQSDALLCTQNEPEGFRRITYFLDRSDVMACYRVTLIGDEKKYPVLLANGNPVERKKLEGGKHSVVWEDPFPKPCYLFALVAGDLGEIRDSFTTVSGREIDLRIYCDQGNEHKCAHAMAALKRSMRWDEEVFGLEYDLDIFMIVAVSAFNMGAMENKGLNIFNASCVLADPKSATDDDFIRIEEIIAHEYFHNWTGNRVTCRDWFQLTLKEGLTVFRDQQYSGDRFSRPMKRIRDVLLIRSRQFPEDAGPMAHPIQPQSFIEVNNFYTTTVYYKGSEVIRMLHTLIGKETFRKGIDTYFSLYDGQAVTTEEFLHAMELASGRDLTQFRRWYCQAGTPEVHVAGEYNKEAQRYQLTVEQTCVPTADNSPKEPFHFPLCLGLVGKGGKELPIGQNFVEVTQAKETFTFENVGEEPVLSINRNFSAPVRLSAERSERDLSFLLAHDSDPVNRWDAGQKLAMRMLFACKETPRDSLPESYLEAYGRLLDDESLDEALKAEALVLPTEASLLELDETFDVEGIHRVREWAADELARHFAPHFMRVYEEMQGADEAEEACAIRQRRLKNVCLHYVSRTQEKEALALCMRQFQTAQTMTDQFAALQALAQIDCSERKEALFSFHKQWKDNALVMNKWFAVQASSKLEGLVDVVESLSKDPVFDWGIPNLVRSLFYVFCRNFVHFHATTGKGYRLVSDVILKLDQKNPLVAATLASGFEKYAKVDPQRKRLMKEQLERVVAEPLSTNVYEVISKTLGQG